MFKKKAIFFLFSLMSLVFLSGCQVNFNEGLKMLDDNLGQTFGTLGGDNEGSKSGSALDFLNKKSESTATATVVGLTMEQKKKIDEWLEKRGLNRYGDAKNAVYTGGTPLFDEKNGQAIERYDYILNKFPNILELIKKGI
jgi:hypothetical protein